MSFCWRDAVIDVEVTCPCHHNCQRAILVPRQLLRWATVHEPPLEAGNEVLGLLSVKDGGSLVLGDHVGL